MQAKAPTKGNLMAAKRSRTLAETGWELMDRKRNILIRELMSRVEEIKRLQGEIDGEFSAAYAALKTAELFCGDCGALAACIPPDDSVSLRYKSVMGVELPSVSADSAAPEVLPYALEDSTAALDEAYRRFAAVRPLLAKLAETENAVCRLAAAIKKSGKRANALENVVIPGLDADIVRIAEVLEEREREEFVRMKVIKAQK